MPKENSHADTQSESRPADLIARLDWQGRALEIDFSHGRSIAIPLDPHGAQPSFFSPSPAAARPLRAGEYVGDVRQGGSCNAEVIEFAPHCHGTHTECLGHVEAERMHVQDVIDDRPTLALLVSLEPEDSSGGHPLWTLAPLRAALPDGLPEFHALIVRTLPDDPARSRRDYALEPEYPVFAADALAHLASLPLEHLLIESPSMDALHDARLVNHRAWWGLDGAACPTGVEAGRRSVTEMVAVPGELADGLYWLHLGLSPLLGDATPSRPMLYPVEIRG